MNWLGLFQEHGIEFITSGPNTARGEFSIKCPWCGPSDPSYHLGINPNSGAWACWRDMTHKGIGPERLLCALLGVSIARARVLAQGYAATNPDSFDALGATLSPVKAKPKPVTWPPEFAPIQAYRLTHKFWVHLWHRGFDDPNQLILRYGLKACLLGRWKGRLIVPVLSESSQLIGWQGRSLQTKADVPRYLSSSADIKNTLFNLNHLKGGKILFVCEGPFDALKIDHYGHKQGINATCTFGVVPKPEQLLLISQLKSKYERIILLFDNDSAAVSSGFGLSDWLKGIEFGNVPEGTKDPGEMSPSQIKKFLKEQVDKAKSS